MPQHRGRKEVAVTGTHCHLSHEERKVNADQSEFLSKVSPVNVAAEKEDRLTKGQRLERYTLGGASNRPFVFSLL